MPEKLLHPIEEAREKLGDVGRTTLYRLIGDGEIQLVKIGRRSFITAGSIDAYVERLLERA